MFVINGIRFVECHGMHIWYGMLAEWAWDGNVRDLGYSSTTRRGEGE